MEDSSEAEARSNVPHDEAFKKLLQTFFAEFIELFFPELDRLLDHRHSKLLMQELLVDIVGGERRTLDLLLETRYRELDAFILVHLETQSHRDEDFHERMFIYFCRLYERYRKRHELIIPIAIFTGGAGREERDTLTMAIAGHDILQFRFLKVELRKLEWRRFIDSDNPVAAALLAKMGYNRKEKRDVRAAFLRMMMRLRTTMDAARMELVLSVANLYFEPDKDEDAAILRELRENDPEGGNAIMEFMSEWRREGYLEGIEKGREEGREAILRKLLEKGMSPEQLADTLGMPTDDIRKLFSTTERT